MFDEIHCAKPWLELYFSCSYLWLVKRTAQYFDGYQYENPTVFFSWALLTADSQQPGPHPHFQKHNTPPLTP